MPETGAEEIELYLWALAQQLGKIVAQQHTQNIIGMGYG